MYTSYSQIFANYMASNLLNKNLVLVSFTDIFGLDQKLGKTLHTMKWKGKINPWMEVTRYFKVVISKKIFTPANLPL